MLTGIPVVYGIDPFSTETVPSHMLGTLGVSADGRKFRYAYVGASALVAGDLLQGPVEDTNDQNITPTAAAVGDTSVLTSSTMTVTANQYADGYMIVSITPGVGHVYRIKSHPAATAAALTFQLKDSIRVALTTTSRVDFVANPYNGVIQNPTTATSCPVGVALTAAALNTYTWIQTGGVACILADGTLTVGTNVSASNGTAGAVEAAVTAQAAVGYAVTGVATTDRGAVWLTID